MKENQKNAKSGALLSRARSSRNKEKSTTRILIKYDAGFGNAIYIRGKGANLSWDKGILLHNLKADEWVWETDLPFNLCEFKVLLNDINYEEGENHHINEGAEIFYNPRF